jgi:hypothetical protein
VQDLIVAEITGQAPADETSRWLATLDDRMSSKLVPVGLTKPRESAALGTFTRTYIDSRKDVKSTTAIKLNRARYRSVECFGNDKPLRAITAGEAEDFRLHLIGKAKLGENSVRRFTGIARQFFRSAMKRGLITNNPFDGLSVTIRGTSRDIVSFRKSKRTE